MTISVIADALKNLALDTNEREKRLAAEVKASCRPLAGDTFDCAADCITALRLERDELRRKLEAMEAVHGGSPTAESLQSKAIHAGLLAAKMLPGNLRSGSAQVAYLKARGWGEQLYDYWRDMTDTKSDFHVDQALQIQFWRDLDPFRSLLNQ